MAGTPVRRRAPPRKPASAAELAAAASAALRKPLRWIKRATSSLLGQTPPQTDPWNLEIAELWRVLPSAAAGNVAGVAPRRRPRLIHPEPPDLRWTAVIRSQTDQIWTTRSRSSGRDSRVTVRLGLFAKESLDFLEINPPSNSVEKYLQICPSFYVLDPELFRFRTRSPPVAVLRVRPWS